MASINSSDDTKEENNQEITAKVNTFSNDGSFLEVYKKKLQEMEFEKQRKEEKTKKKNEAKLKRLNNQLQAKRKGTSHASKDDSKKQKQDQDDSEKSSAWKAYMAEVDKYKSQVCTDDSESIRPLVK
ncbi:Uncharacterized protein C19orf43 [Trichoplax sp. H2]|nr:Uncharacterized protein C19orf43 [Trichoplax sp. H2]|eukprot:RDD47833.1 Uncharacterized protein C19orf43 [Trichoplax sp. H2]